MEELKFLHEMAAETEVLAYGSTAAIGGRMTDTGGGKYYCRSVSWTYLLETERTICF